MARIILNIFVLLVVVLAFASASNPPPTWGGAGGEIAPTQVPVAPPSNQDTCPPLTREMLECVRRWACQYLIRLDLRCLLNLNGFPLVGNNMGNFLGGAGGGSTGSPLLGGNDGVLGGLLG